MMTPPAIQKSRSLRRVLSTLGGVVLLVGGFLLSGCAAVLVNKLSDQAEEDNASKVALEKFSTDYECEQHQCFVVSYRKVFNDSTKHWNFFIVVDGCDQRTSYICEYAGGSSIKCGGPQGG